MAVEANSVKLYDGGVTMGFKNLIYQLLKVSNDVNAVQKGKVARRIGRRVAGKATGKMLGRLFK